MRMRQQLILAAALGLAASCHAASGQYISPGQTAAATVKSAVNYDTETLPSGVRVEHLQRGRGQKPTADQAVTVHYRGTLVANGAEFDSSYTRGQPATFPLRQVVPCWTEGLQRLAVGGKAVLTCPAATAYGSRGAGGAVPPNADLRFEVELLAVR